MQKKFLIYIISLSSICTSFAFNGKKSILLPYNKKLTIEEYDREELPIGKGWKNRINISINDTIISKKEPPINEDLDHGQHHYFVPIEKNRYFKDLNKDSAYEIAIVATSGGNAMFVDAYLYTLKNEKLIFYDKARFNQEGKYPVIFGCYSCDRWNLNSLDCEKCTTLMEKIAKNNLN
ncbi:MAG: hypothetical protein N4A33_06965 [Bacteriovoracaceae bacterium]|jgi:hypothetical protein|nr:hypothetical protein [Bacteriovoracaceae bacterium]